MDEVRFTLKGIRQHRPCGLERGSGYGYDLLRKNLGKGYGDETPITITQIYESNKYDDALWCLRASDERFHHLWHHFSVDCAKQVEHLMTDKRSLDSLVVARNFADGKASKEELAAARDAARDAAGDAAWDATWDAARDAAWDAARTAAWAAVETAAVAAWDAARAAQIRLLQDYCRLGKRPDNSVELLRQYIPEAMAA